MTNFGPKYPKINTIFERTERGVVIPEKYATPEIGYLADAQWNWTEKVDGTNIRLFWNGYYVTIGGRTNGDDAAGSQLEAMLVDYIINEASLTFADTWKKIARNCEDMTVYGEGYGKGISDGAQYRDSPAFIIFDVRVGEWWLGDDDIRDVADKLGCYVVPQWGTMTVNEAWEVIKSGSLTSHWPNAKPEGLVGRPAIDLYSRKGERVLAKTKVKDWADYQREETRLIKEAELEAKRAAKTKAFNDARKDAPVPDIGPCAADGPHYGGASHDH